MRKKILFLSSILFLSALSFSKAASAICPVCTIAVGGGVGLSRWLGIDDVITGLWIGGFVVSLVFWTIDWLDKKNIRFPFRKLAVWAGYYLVIIIPLFNLGIMGHPFNKIWGIDKLLAGTILGSIGFLIGALAYPKIKEKNGGKAHFPFEKIAIAIFPLIASAFWIKRREELSMGKTVRSIYDRPFS